MVWTNLSHPPQSSPPSAAGSSSYSVPLYASWFDLDQVHDIERRALPEFFAPLPPSIGRPSKRPLIDDKTPAVYQEWRDFMVKTWRARPQEYLSITVCRRHLTGDVGAMMRVHAFLEQWGLINYLKGEGRRDGSGFVDYPEIVAGAVDVANTTASITTAGLSNQPAERAVVKCAGCEVECPRLYYSHVPSTAPAAASTSLYSICGLCYAEGKYPSGLMASDFVKVDVAAIENSCRKAWSEEEVLKLLDAVEKHPKDWERVSKMVGKPKDQCIFQFLKLPAMESIEFGSETFAELDKVTPIAGSLPFNISENPIMSTLSFLAATVHPKVAAAAAQAALEEIHQLKVTTDEDPNTNSALSSDNLAQIAATSIACAATRATQFADDEIRKISKLTETYFELELAKLRLKMSIFEDLEKGLEEDRRDLENQRLSLLYERVSLRKQMINMDNPSTQQLQQQPSPPPPHPILSNDMMDVDSTEADTTKSEVPNITTL